MPTASGCSHACDHMIYDYIVMFDSVFQKTGISLERLRTFCLVAEAGSIARAAGRDPIRQSQFSRQIKELEEHFEVELVRREGKGLVLTDAGFALARTARAQLGALEDYESQCRATPVTFRLGAGDTLLRWLVIPRLRPRAGTRIVLETRGPGAVTSGLQDSSLDFGLTHASRGARLGRVRYQLVVPRKLALETDARWIVANVPMVVPLGDEEFSASFGHVALPALECDTFPQAWCAVESGHYAAVLPDLAKAPPGALTVDWPALHALDRTIHLAANERAMRTRPNAEAVRAWLKSALRF